MSSATDEFLLLGDLGTAKSKLIDRARQLGWRTVGVSSKRATVPGLTAAVEQDDFGDSEWVMKAGAFVKANGGTVCIDELHDMNPDTRAGVLEPMSKQRFSANLTGESVTFQTEASVVAAGNPKHGRFDPYEPVPEQFASDSAFISRFDLVFTMRDVPDEEEDRNIADHILPSRDAAKRGNWDNLEDDDLEKIQPPVEGDLLQKWIYEALIRAVDYNSGRVQPPLAKQSSVIGTLHAVGNGSYGLKELHKAITAARQNSDLFRVEDDRGDVRLGIDDAETLLEKIETNRSYRESPRRD